MARERCAGIEAQAQVEQGCALPKPAPGERAASSMAPARRDGRGIGDDAAASRRPTVQASSPWRAAARRDALSARSARSAVRTCSTSTSCARSRPRPCSSQSSTWRASGGPPAVIGNYLVGAAQLHLGDLPRRSSISNAHSSCMTKRRAGRSPISPAITSSSFILIWLGLALLYHGELRRAIADVAAAVNDARSRAHPFTLVSALHGARALPQQHRRLAGAIEDTEEAAVIAAEQRSPYHQSRAAILRAVNLSMPARGRGHRADGERARRSPRHRRQLPEFVQPVAPRRGACARRPHGAGVGWPRRRSPRSSAPASAGGRPKRNAFAARSAARGRSEREGAAASRTCAGLREPPAGAALGTARGAESGADRSDEGARDAHAHRAAAAARPLHRRRRSRRAAAGPAADRPGSPRAARDRSRPWPCIRRAASIPSGARSRPRFLAYGRNDNRR